MNCRPRNQRSSQKNDQNKKFWRDYTCLRPPPPLQGRQLRHSHCPGLLASLFTVLRGLSQRRGSPQFAVPSFVPTTKPYPLTLTAPGSAQSLAGQGICGEQSHPVTLGASC